MLRVAAGVDDRAAFAEEAVWELATEAAGKGDLSLELCIRGCASTLRAAGPWKTSWVEAGHSSTSMRTRAPHRYVPAGPLLRAHTCDMSRGCHRRYPLTLKEGCWGQMG